MKPQYQQKNIVNLMSSTLPGLGSSSSYQPLPQLPPEKLAAARNVILLVVDGLGYEQVLSSSGFLRKPLVGKLIQRRKGTEQHRIIVSSPFPLPKNQS